MDASTGVHPEELSRRISQIDLTSLRHHANTQTENVPPRYSAEELLRLRPRHECRDAHAALAEGLKTPPDVPAPPTNTPAHRPGTPEHHLTELQQNGAVPEALEVNGERTKKKKKSSGKNKKAAPTGFEEFYADPPTTPDEHEEEGELYSSTRPLAERLQTCIQRYRKRRNLDSVRANILTKYLLLGGVESSSSKQFTGGLDKETLENSTAAEIAVIQATDFIRSGAKNPKYYDPNESDHWVVDFEGVAKGFLSWSAPNRVGTDTEQEIKTFCLVVKNFLNYLITHAVCSEYTQDILAARKVCDLAEKELCNIKHLRYDLPGDFNIAASTLYGGRYREMITSNQTWAKDDPFSQDYTNLNRGISLVEAERIFQAGIAFAGSDALFHNTMEGIIHIVSSETKYFEVARIERPDGRDASDYSRIKDHQGAAGSIKALGNIYLKSWDGPGIDNEDMTDDEGEETSSVSNVDSLTEAFWLEDEVLKHCFIGLKLELVVHELNIGVKFFDDIMGLYCSFHTILPNEKVIDNWKEPAPNIRPPPTEDDPDAEERALNIEMERELNIDEKLFGGEKKIDVTDSDAKPAKA